MSHNAIKHEELPSWQRNVMLTALFGLALFLAGMTYHEPKAPLIIMEGFVEACQKPGCLP